MKPIHRTVLKILAAALLIAVLILVTAPPRGHSVVLLPAPTPAPITVHVAGAVRSPGLYELPPASRLSAAIQAAGGLTETADKNAINLAAILRDSEKWVIPEIGAAPEPNTQPLPDTSRSSGPIASLIDLNTATAVDLETLPGIGPVLAQQIVSYREEHGRFQNVEELQDVPGIGTVKYEALKAFITVN